MQHEQAASPSREFACQCRAGAVGHAHDPGGPLTCDPGNISAWHSSRRGTTGTVRSLSLCAHVTHTTTWALHSSLTLSFLRLYFLRFLSSLLSFSICPVCMNICLSVFVTDVLSVACILFLSAYLPSCLPDRSSVIHYIVCSFFPYLSVCLLTPNYPSVCACVLIALCVCGSTRVYVRVYVCAFACECLQSCICLYICVCVLFLFSFFRCFSVETRESDSASKLVTCGVRSTTDKADYSVATVNHRRRIVSFLI